MQFALAACLLLSGTVIAVTLRNHLNKTTIGIIVITTTIIPVVAILIEVSRLGMILLTLLFVAGQLLVSLRFASFRNSRMRIKRVVVAFPLALPSAYLASRFAFGRLLPSPTSVTQSSPPDMATALLSIATSVVAAYIYDLLRGTRGKAGRR